MKKFEKLKKLIPMDQESIIVWHTLKPNEVIKEHVHVEYDEYILIDNGKFTTILDGETTGHLLKNEEKCISFPAGHLHGFQNDIEPITYFVLRIKNN